jgi:hypothetical protein
MDTGDHVAVKVLDKAKVHKKKLAGKVECHQDFNYLH